MWPHSQTQAANAPGSDGEASEVPLGDFGVEQEEEGAEMTSLKRFNTCMYICVNFLVKE
jgi:hypothetical protein